MPSAFCEGVIRGFYPIGRGAVRKTGDGEIPRSNRPQIAGGLNEAVMAGKQVCLCAILHKTNPVQGVRAYWLAQPGSRGEFSPGDRWNRSDQLRRPGEKPGDEKLNHERRESAWE